MPQDYVLFTANDVMNGIHPLNLDMRPDDRYFRFYFETGLNCFRMADGNVVDLEGLLGIANRGIARWCPNPPDTPPIPEPIPDYLRPIIPDTPLVCPVIYQYDADSPVMYTNTTPPSYATLFNKRHYDHIARLLDIIRRDHAVTPDQKELVCAVVEMFTKHFSEDNKRFDRQKFISACNS